MVRSPFHRGQIRHHLWMLGSDVLGGSLASGFGMRKTGVLFPGVVHADADFANKGDLGAERQCRAAILFGDALP